MKAEQQEKQDWTCSRTMQSRCLQFDLGKRHIEYSMYAFVMNILNDFEMLLPLAVAWAQAQESHILKHGEPLCELEKRDAQQIGVTALRPVLQRDERLRGILALAEKAEAGQERHGVDAKPLL